MLPTNGSSGGPRRPPLLQQLADPQPEEQKEEGAAERPCSHLSTARFPLVLGLWLWLRISQSRS